MHAPAIPGTGPKHNLCQLQRATTSSGPLSPKQAGIFVLDENFAWIIAASECRARWPSWSG